MNEHARAGAVWVVIVAAGLVGSTGCSSDPAVSTDAGSGGDAGPAGDAGPRGDAGVGADAGFTPPSDAGERPDTGPAMSGTIAGCTIFPADNPWNQDVSALPMHPRAAQILANMSPATTMHPDWGNWSTDHYGIPWVAGTGAPPVEMMWTESWGSDQSDPLACPTGGGMFCYPIPTTAPIEGGPGASTGSDRHVLYLDTAGAPGNCTLYELYNTQNFVSSPWRAINGAIFHLSTNALRPEGWTSADAAGLPILPGLVRVEEVLAGEIRHAIRFTVETTAEGYIHPATHQAGVAGTDLPPMGLRLRLRADFPTTGLMPSAVVIIRAMQRYGIILADNGSDWFITGDSDDRWDPLMDDVITGLRTVHGSDFQVLDTGPTLGP